MFKQEYRPMTEQEKKIVHALVYGQPASVADKFIRGFIVLFGSPVAGLMAAGALGAIGERLGLLKNEKGSPVIMALLLTGIILGFIFGIITLIKEKSGKRKINKMFEKDLMDAKILSLLCQTNAVIEVEEFEDEGPGYFIDIGDGKIMFLQGQYLYDGVESKKFPNKEFEITKLMHSGVILDILCKGAPLVPSRVLKTTAILANEDPLVYDGDIFTGKLETIEQDIRKLKNNH